jgi:hypothetical protein
MNLLESISACICLIFAIVMWGLPIGFYCSSHADKRLIIPLSIAAGVTFLAVAGFTIAVQPFEKRAVAILLLATATGNSIRFLVMHRADVGGIFGRSDISALVLWFLTAAFSLVVTHADIKRPPVLFDGPYVFKDWILPVKIQALCNDLPPDNAIPMVVAEYLLRDIPFEKERPIMPGQEVSNRPILLSLATVPIRAIFSTTGPYQGSLPKLNYVGSEWPNAISLVRDKSFRQFLVVAVSLNAALVIGFFYTLIFLNFDKVKLATITYCLISPYFLLHTFFTWPKNLAAFFIVISILCIAARAAPLWIPGVLLGLAYWSHPYSVVFILISSLTIAYFTLTKRCDWKAAALFVTAVTVSIAPWLIWSRFVLAIPSDLIAQNTSNNGTLAELIAVRLHNLKNLFLPNFLPIFPFDASRFIRNYLINLSAPLGITLFAFLPVVAFRPSKSTNPILFWLTISPGLILILIFSYRSAVPLLHGWQAVWPTLAAIVLSTLSFTRLKGLVLPLLVLQFSINLCVLAIWFNLVLNW